MVHTWYIKIKSKSIKKITNKVSQHFQYQQQQQKIEML